MEVAEVEGATGYIDTNFEGKAKAAIDCLERNDLVYVHFEAPDECGHRNEPENKVRAIELIDERVLPIIFDGLKKYAEENADPINAARNGYIDNIIEPQFVRAYVVSALQTLVR